jgi:hypothetical protein
MDSCTDPNETGSTPLLKGKNKVGGSSTTVPSEPAASIITGRSTSEFPVEQDKATTSSAAEVTSDPANKDDIQLVIRIPNGPSLQIKLTKKDVLRKVKNFVDENKGSWIGSYNLAMLYPRKVFTEQGTESSPCTYGHMSNISNCFILHLPFSSLLQGNYSIFNFCMGEAAGLFYVMCG